MISNKLGIIFSTVQAQIKKWKMWGENVEDLKKKKPTNDYRQEGFSEKKSRVTSLYGGSLKGASVAVARDHGFSPSGIWWVLLGCRLTWSSSAGSAGRIYADGDPVGRHKAEPSHLLCLASLFTHRLMNGDWPEDILLTLHGSSL